MMILLTRVKNSYVYKKNILYVLDGSYHRRHR